MVECTGLENQRAARYRGFESLSLRLKNLGAEAGGPSPRFGYLPGERRRKYIKDMSDRKLMSITIV